MQPWFDRLREALDVQLLALGGTRITLWNVVVLTTLAALIVWLSGLLRGLIVRALHRGGKVEIGAAEGIASIARYIIVVVGLLLVIQTAGIDVTTLNVLAGAVGLGVGFGLQKIASNFISGVVLLIGRPIKIGDRIDVAGVEGDVVEIGARATTVVTNDNISIIVPNEKFVSETVINWSFNDRRVRFRIPVQAAYGTDPRLVERLLTDVARADPDVLDEPPPSVRFVAFGDNGLQFELRAWSTTLMHRKGLLTSNLNFAIHDALAKHGIEVPFPQRVVHLRQER